MRKIVPLSKIKIFIFQKYALLFVLSGVFCFGQNDKWTKKVDFDGGHRIGAVGFSISGKGYIGTGGNMTSAYNDFWEFDPSTDKWTKKADFPATERLFSTGFSIGAKGYIGTGNTLANENQNDFYEYNPAIDKWTKKADFPGVPRWAALGFSIGSKGYIGLGGSDSTQYFDFYEYDPAADKWTKKADFPASSNGQFYTAFTIGSFAYIQRGNNLFEFDPVKNKWTQKSDIPNTNDSCLSFSAGFSIGSRGFIACGSVDCPNYTQDISELWEYNPFKDSWRQLTDVPASRSDGVAFSLSGNGYLGIGAQGGLIFLKDFFEYIPGDTLDDVSEYHTYQNVSLNISPNPLNGFSSLSYSLSKPSFVDIRVSDLSGNQILNINRGLQETGKYEYIFDGSSFSSGAYVAAVIIDGIPNTRKIVVMH